MSVYLNYAVKVNIYQQIFWFEPGVFFLVRSVYSDNSEFINFTHPWNHGLLIFYLDTATFPLISYCHAVVLCIWDICTP